MSRTTKPDSGILTPTTEQAVTRADEHIFHTLQPLCVGIDDEILRDFVSRMDPEYFDRFQPEIIARHLRLVERLDPDHPCQIDVAIGSEGLYDLVIVAYDYFSEFAIICGLLSAFGLDIREGSIYTFAEAQQKGTARLPSSLPRRRLARQRAGLSRKKIVDCFQVRPLMEGSWATEDQRRFDEELTALLQLLEGQRFQQARRRLNGQLVQRLARVRGQLSRWLSPVHIRFDNEQSYTDTVMDIRSSDTPAFLYALANALAMRGIYIHKARLENIGADLHDRLYVRNRHGQKITDVAALHELRATAVLIKQFTHFLTWAPDPGKAIEHFDQFLDRILEEAGSATAATALAFLKKKHTLALLARLLGSSDFLWEDFLRRQHANLLPLMATYQRAPLIRPRNELTRVLRRKLTATRNDEQKRHTVNTFKDQEMFRIDMKHLAEPALPLADFSRALTELAEVVLEETIRAVIARLSRQYGKPRTEQGTRCPFSIVGMGKLGGQELGYASDIEVLFIYGEAGSTSGRQSVENSEFFERAGQEMLRWVEAKQEGIFHLDVRLRPHGAKGQLANSLAELRRYYSPSGLSAPFERQALIKLRHVAGDPTLGRAVEQLRDSFVYSGTPWNLSEALELRKTQIMQLVEPGQINVKYSPGGLIDVEYAVQYLQLMHGHRHPELRTPNTLEALAALGGVGVLGSGDCEALRSAYLLFRLLIDGLRIVRGNAKDLVLPPAESEAFVFLARRVGYASEDWRAGAAKLETDITTHMQRTRAFFEQQFQRM